MAIHRAVLFAVTVVSAVLVACIQAVYPPVSPDSTRKNVRPVLGLTTEQAPPPDPPCARDVALLDVRIAGGRPYDVVSRVSVTCGVGLAQSCDDRLKARACAVGADAVVVDDVGDRGPTGGMPSKSATLVRWRSVDGGVD